MRAHASGLSCLHHVFYVLIGYAASQAHELAHWAAAMAMGADQLVMGFDRWCLSGLRGPLWPVLAAGPITTLSLALLGLTLLLRGDARLVKRLGAFLAFYNSVFNLGGVLTKMVSVSAGDTLLHDLGCSEHAWKAL
ncbi:hypothetical protein B6U99_05720 [Candidatus Geothermarchaeota archaeon ex4572_27]|nr:MAG: hypothetical protein B6U99_05720 [Candidatus Geothermarchaeota archaeon ex4572_27]